MRRADKPGDRSLRVTAVPVSGSLRNSAEWSRWMRLAPVVEAKREA